MGQSGRSGLLHYKVHHTVPYLKEAITREQSLRALTINVAYAWHQEHRLGSIEFGKIANMTVYDCDFLRDDIEKVAEANLVATIVDGEEVYKA